MKRGFAVFLLCAPIAFGQRSRPATPTPPHVVFVDAVVSGTAGQPVSGLSAGDFELTQTGEPQKITNFTWFDARQHLANSTAASPAGADAPAASRELSPAPPRVYELAPEDIRRNIILIVDDLSLTPERVAAVQNVLRVFVDQQLAADDRVAILRTSSGVGWRQQLTNTHQALAAQIAQIQPLGRGLTGASVASAIWQSIRWAEEGLRAVPGRKAVVLLSEHLDAPLTAGSDFEIDRFSLASAASAAGMVFYTVDPRGPVEPPRTSSLASLVAVTGGLSAPDLAGVLRDQEGYYVLGFRPSQELNASTPAVLKLRDKVLNLRWRFGFLSPTVRRRALVPPDRTTAIQAQMGATGGADIRTRITPLFNGFSRTGATVDVLLHIDARDFSAVRDSKDTHHVSAEIQVSAFGDNGKVAGGPPTGYNMTLTGAQYERACEGGLIYTTRLTVPAPGGYQIRAIVVDGLSDRVGSAMQFVEVPEANKGRLAVGGLLLKGEASGKPLAEGLSVERETAAVRIFKPGVPIGFSYAVFNASLGPAKDSRVQVVTRIYATGREVYHGTPIDLEFPAGNGPLVREVNGKVQLDSRLSPGEYVIEVEVTDKLAKESSPHVAFQYMTFEVRE